jgi:hypothetical protein
MRRLLGCIVALIAVLSFGVPPRPQAEPAEKRSALVIGNAAYQAGETSANDAGLIAQTLQAAGFDVVGARDQIPRLLMRTVSISSCSAVPTSSQRPHRGTHRTKR